MVEPTLDMIRAVRAGCNSGVVAGARCKFPLCGCAGPERIVRATLAELAEPSEEMLAAVGKICSRNEAETIWRWMMRRVLRGPDG